MGRIVYNIGRGAGKTSELVKLLKANPDHKVLVQDKSRAKIFTDLGVNPKQVQIFKGRI